MNEKELINEVTRTQKAGRRESKYKIGEQIEILYDPEKDPIVKTVWNLWMGGFVVLFMGCLFSWSSIAYLLGWKNIISPK